MWCFFFFLTTTLLRQLNSDAIYLEMHKIPQVKGPFQTPITNQGCYLCFWPTSYRSNHDPLPSSLINSFEQLTKLRNMWLTRLWGYEGRPQLRNSRREDRHGACRKDCRAAMPSLGVPLFSVLTSLEKLWTPSLWVFLEASLHWPLVIELNHLWPSPPTICRGVGRTESPTLLLPATSPAPSLDAFQITLLT